MEINTTCISIERHLELLSYEKIANKSLNSKEYNTHIKISRFDLRWMDHMSDNAHIATNDKYVYEIAKELKRCIKSKKSLRQEFISKNEEINKYKIDVECSHEIIDQQKAEIDKLKNMGFWERLFKYFDRFSVFFT